MTIFRLLVALLHYPKISRIRSGHQVRSNRYPSSILASSISLLASATHTGGSGAGVSVPGLWQELSGTVHFGNRATT